MNKASEYANFAGWFAGLGYVALWPLTASGQSGKPFGASVLCDGSALTGWLCPSAQPLRLPEGLHALGAAAALFVAVRIAILAIGRIRRQPPPAMVDVPPSEVPIVPIAPAPAAVARNRRPAPPPRRPVKPRKHFGLRNVPR